MMRDPRRLLAALLLSALAGCAAPAADTRPSATPDSSQRKVTPEMLRAAEIALDEGRHADATVHYRQIASVEPDNKAALYGMAEIQLAVGDAGRARDLYDRLTDDPAYGGRARQGRGLALLMLGQRRAALEAMTGAVAADPGLWRAWNGLGQIYDAERAWEKSRESYQNALAVVPDSGVVHNNLGFSLMLQGQTDEAARLFLAALRQQPDLAAARGNLRLALAWQGRYVEAMAGVGTAQLPTVLNNLGFVAMMRGELDVAEAYFTRAIEASPSYYHLAANNLLRLKAMRSAATGSPTKGP